MLFYYNPYYYESWLDQKEGRDIGNSFIFLGVDWGGGTKGKKNSPDI